MKTHTELLNYLATKYNLKSYLEIGVQNPANNFDKIKCEHKVGVDPECDANNVFKMTSDGFFNLAINRPKEFTNTVKRVLSMPDKFDLIFIDGLHHADQVKRDFENSLKCLNDGGFIVIHDTLPENEEGTKVPRETKVWWGSVYQFAMTLNSRTDVGFFTLNIDNGCTVIWKHQSEIDKTKLADDYNLDWETYKSVGSVLLNVIQPEQLETYI